MRNFFTLGLIAVCCCLGCVSADSKAKELYDTALFEEKQNNFEHAATLYNEILRRFPDAPLAKDASTRLNTLRLRKP